MGEHEDQAAPGREAEELRRGIEDWLDGGWDNRTDIDEVRRNLQDLLDSVDARDSLGYLIAKDAKKISRPRYPKTSASKHSPNLRPFDRFGGILLTVRAANVLRNQGIDTADKFRCADLSEMRRWNNCGPKTTALIQRAQLQLRRGAAL